MVVILFKLHNWMITSAKEVMWHQKNSKSYKRTLITFPGNIGKGARNIHPFFCTSFIHTHRGQEAGDTLDRSPAYCTTTIHTHGQFRPINSTKKHVFGLWGETGVSCRRPKPRFKPRTFFLWGGNANNCEKHFSEGTLTFDLRKVIGFMIKAKGLWS